jgi:hypothetical protein
MYKTVILHIVLAVRGQSTLTMAVNGSKRRTSGRVTEEVT